ncbi:DsbA family protein [Ornithinimicrobium murale]|uniref:DsbA family protein n=1 Tax=Ornithinimicrobium murale TaxID=1050153 RepID=UPI000E0D667A|nr:thioredoxin domain-containing protein [Ornithinimicrobium murale]
MAQKKNKAQQQSARERVRQQQQHAAARDQRMKVVFRSLIGVAVLVVVAVVAAIALNQGGTSSATPTTVTDDGGIVLDPGGEVAGGDAASATADDAGTTAGDVPQVSTYIDFQCPHCLTFEQANLPFLTDGLESGTISLAVHPVALMDNASQGTNFSSRAANAAVCVAEHQPEALLDVTQGLFDLQQTAAQGGVNDEVLTGAVADAGADSSAVRGCILEEEFAGWVRESTDRALSDPALAGPSGRFGTPTVLVDGQVYNGSIENPDELGTFIEQHR